MPANTMRLLYGNGSDITNEKAVQRSKIKFISVNSYLSGMKKAVCVLLYSMFFHLFAQSQTTITKWKDDKRGAVSITYDDGNRNQFKYMLPVMERLQLPATFYIITGPIIGSRYPTKFIGRPVREIMKETELVPTNAT